HHAGGGHRVVPFAGEYGHARREPGADDLVIDGDRERGAGRVRGADLDGIVPGGPRDVDDAVLEERRLHDDLALVVRTRGPVLVRALEDDRVGARRRIGVADDLRAWAGLGFDLRIAPVNPVLQVCPVDDARVDANEFVRAGPAGDGIDRAADRAGRGDVGNGD